jgi:hypothetical protein
MTHLTATLAATAHGQMDPTIWARRDHGVRVHPTGRMAEWAESKSYSPMANFLELRDPIFHTSVIGGRANIVWIRRSAGRHFSYVGTATANARDDVADARAHAGGE